MRIHLDVGAARSIGMHWGTFQLSAEPFFEPEQRLRQAVADAGLAPDSFLTLEIGESIDFGR